MPFSFALPTTSSFSFSPFFGSASHPFLPLTASTYRGVFRDTLKKHKRLPPTQQAPHLSSVLLSLNNYIPYLLTLDQGLSEQVSAKPSVEVVLKLTPILRWRPTLSENLVPGREIAKIKVNSLEVSLYPLYSMRTALPSPEQRTIAITTATKHLLTAGSIHEYLSICCDQISEPSPCIDISQSTFKALASLALAEATLLAVLKDDPYSMIFAQDRNKCDKEWMIKPPDIPKVRANLFARLCLAAAEHITNGLSLLNNSSAKGQGKINHDLLKYMDDLRKTSRAKACRFFGISAELDGQLGLAIAWLHAAMYEFGTDSEEASKTTLKKLKKDWDVKREGKKMDKGNGWGDDAGKIEEGRILDLLKSKWSKINDTINTQIIPHTGPLIAAMPSGRDIYSLKLFPPPKIEDSVLETLKATNYDEDSWEKDSSDEDSRKAYPETSSTIHCDYSNRGSYF